MTPLLLAALAAAPLADAPAAHALRYRFEPGTSLRYEVVTSNVYDSKQTETAQKVRSGGTTVQRADVLDVPPGAAGRIRIHSESVKLSARFDDQPETSFDSTSPAPVPPGYEAAAAVADAALSELTIAPTGEVTRGVSLLPGADELDPAQTTAAYRDLFPRLPAEPVAVGDSWTTDGTVKIAEGKLQKPWTLRRTSTLTAVENGVATIAVKIVPLPPPTDPEFRQQLAMRCPSGTVTFDVNRGVLLTSVAKVDDQIIGFRGPGSLLRLVSSHEQRLVGTGPTGELTADAPGAEPRAAAAPARPTR